MSSPKLITALAIGISLFSIKNHHSTLQRINSSTLQLFNSSTGGGDSASKSLLHYDLEKHIKNIKQLTFDGDNAEAYWSFDSKKLIFQATNPKWSASCDQIFYYDITKGQSMDAIPPKLISTGMGRTTCSYFLPGDSTILYASTHLGSKECPMPPEHRKDGKYVWAVYPDFDIFVAGLDGKIIKQLTNSPGYDAEATVSPKKDKIVFTSSRSGDMELYTMNIDGSNVKQITHDLGYDGGAFFSPDGTKLVFRASRPKTDADIKEYKELLAQNLVMPTAMELYTCNVDGSDMKQITHLGGANWSPFFTPDGKKIIFSSNYKSNGAYPFNLYIINCDGTGLEQVTSDNVFDAFPVFSPDGTKIVFSSHRLNTQRHGINLFLADWEN